MYSLGNFFADQTALNPPIPKTQYGMLVSLQVIKESDGDIRLGTCEALPTLCIRDKSGTLGASHSVLPVVGGKIPAFVTDEGSLTMSARAYEHIVGIVGEEFMAADVVG